MQELWNAYVVAFLEVNATDVARSRGAPPAAAPAPRAPRLPAPSVSAGGSGCGSDPAAGRVSTAGVRGAGGQPEVDWVARGERMEAKEVAKARAQWKAMLGRLMAYPAPPKAFKGRGIVMTG